MKVNPKVDLYLRSIEPRPAAKRDVAAAPEVQGDSIAISTTARLLQAALETEEPYAAENVARLKSALEQGRYEVSSQRLAASLAGEMAAERGRSR